MKRKIVVGLMAFSFLFIVSCKKNSVPANGINTAITGKWNILSDSTFFGVGINNHPVNYTGETGDYFDFRTDGNLYIKEGTVLDTLAYSLSSDTTISIVSFGVILNGVAEVSHITDLTAHSVTIKAPVVITPGGEFERKVHLNR